MGVIFGIGEVEGKISTNRMDSCQYHPARPKTHNIHNRYQLNNNNGQVESRIINI
jgi:hypothetical protein